MNTSPLRSIGLAVSMALTFTFAQAQTYTVVKSKGIVHCDRLKKDLQPGDKIESQDKLKFDSPEALLIVINPKDGRKAVKPGGNNAPSELRSLLTNIVALEKRNTGVRGHGHKTKNDIALDTLKAQLNIPKLVVLGNGKISFAGTDLTLNDTAMIIARYKSGEKQKVVSSRAVVNLSKSNVFGTKTPDQIQLLYLPNINKGVFDSSPQSLGSLFLVYIEDEEQLKREVQVVKSTFPDKNQENVIKEVKKYIEDEYGAVLNENLIQWLKEANLIKP